MITLFTFILNLFFLTSGINTDSLLTVLNEADDSKKIEIYLELSWYNRSGDPGAALLYSERAQKIAEESGDQSNVCKSINYQGVIYRNIGNYSLALSRHREALTLSEKIKDPVQIAYSKNNLGGIYLFLGDYSIAGEYFLDALKIFESIHDERGIGYCTYNLGKLHQRQENFNKAIRFYKRAYEYRVKENDKLGSTASLKRIAEIYFEKQKYAESLEYYNRIEKIYRELNDKKGIAASLAGIGGIYCEQGKFKKAKEYKLKALVIELEIDNKEGIIDNYIKLGFINAKEKNFAIALKSVNTALDLAKEIDLKIKINESYEMLSEIYLLKKDYKNSLFYFKKHINVKDSLFTTETAQQIAETEIKYNIEKRERENVSLKEDIEQQLIIRRFSIAILILLILFEIVLFIRYRQNKKLNAKLKDLNETKNRFFYILAHDLKNPFNSLQANTQLLLDESSSLNDEEIFTLIKQINSSSSRLLALTENLLDWSRVKTGTTNFSPENIDVHELIMRNLELFTPISKSKNITLQTETDKGLYCYCDKYMVETVIRNLLDNAIKFSYEKSKVIVTSEKLDDLIKINIIDEGMGINSSDLDKLFRIDIHFSTSGTKNEQGTGLGLILIKDFIEMNGGTIQVSSEIGKGCTFSFTLPQSHH